MMRPPETDRLWPWVRYFLEEHLPHHRGVSLHTLDAYRITFRLFRRFLSQRSPSVLEEDMRLKDFQPLLLLEFLAWLESPRGKSVRPQTRNCRLAVLKSFSRFLELYRKNEEAFHWQRLRQIPFKVTARANTDYFESHEIDSVLSQIPAYTRDGFRDLTLLALLYNTGARADEVASLHCSGLLLEESPAVRLMGKGRRERVCPLWAPTAILLHRYLQHYRRRPKARYEPFVFINQRGERLSRFGVGRIVDKYLRQAALTTPSLKTKHLSTHSLRHSTAIHLLESGADINVIKTWLGHRSTRSTSRYLDMNLEAQREVIERFAPPSILREMAGSDSSDLLTPNARSADIGQWLERL